MPTPFSMPMQARVKIQEAATISSDIDIEVTLSLYLSTSQTLPFNLSSFSLGAWPDRASRQSYSKGRPRGYDTMEDDNTWPQNATTFRRLPPERGVQPSPSPNAIPLFVMIVIPNPYQRKPNCELYLLPEILPDTPPLILSFTKVPRTPDFMFQLVMRMNMRQSNCPALLVPSRPYYASAGTPSHAKFDLQVCHRVLPNQMRLIIDFGTEGIAPGSG
ncbi:uncharacterized protein RAG0_11233 [Rhynchosporium agropyri]|uniref:Uncharacterized protein n=1 Tax=Rhynchosporium agropyri TaxID=914238 RepID=A0A1E1L5U1_9HELO|nr:uncharacterized protein RAG0_11233 [Rhynchosporium agropyri]